MNMPHLARLLNTPLRRLMTPRRRNMPLMLPPLRRSMQQKMSHPTG